jgi:hypothetical protein
LDRRRIRDTFERRFTARRMAEDYVAHYERLIHEETHQATSVCLFDRVRIPSPQSRARPDTR